MLDYSRLAWPTIRLLLAATLSITALAPGVAQAGCDVSPMPPMPQPCDPGGDRSEIEVQQCNFTGFTSGSWASIGSGGPNSATSIPRITIFEGQASSEISNCDVFNPQNLSQLLFSTDARALATSDAFELGMQITDFRPGRGDTFGGTLEAANARVADSIAALQGMSPNQDLDVVITLSGGFLGTSGRPTVQMGARDFNDAILGVVFVASMSPPLSPIVWRHLECPDPRNDPGCALATFVDETSGWPGSYDLHLKLPATVGNGITVELKAESSQFSDAPPGQSLTLDFHNSAVIDIRPPQGASVTMSSGQVFSGPTLPPRPFEVELDAEDSLGFVDEGLAGDGDTPLEVGGSTGPTSVEAKGIAGSGRLLAETFMGEVCTSGGVARLGWQDVITATGAETYRMEFEVVGEVVLPTAVDVPQGFARANYAVGVNAVSNARTTVGGKYELSGTGSGPAPCDPQDQIEIGDACFEFGTELAQIPWDVTGTGDLGEGPVVVGFEVDLADGQPQDFEFFAAAGTNILIGGIGPADDCEVSETTVDLGSPGRYVRFLGITGATTAGQPDASYSIDSERGFDYSQPVPLVAALPEPGLALSAVTSLVVLGLLRRRAVR